MNDPLALSSDLSSSTTRDRLRVRICVPSVPRPLLPVRRRRRSHFPPRWLRRFISLHMCLSVCLSNRKPSFLEVANIYHSGSYSPGSGKGKKLKMAHAMTRTRRRECLPLLSLVRPSSASFFVSVVLGFLPPSLPSFLPSSGFASSLQLSRLISL